MPLDLEDVVGVAIADLLRRAGKIIAVVYGGSLIAMLGLAVGAVVAGWFEYGSIGLGRAGIGRLSVLSAPLIPLISGWAVIYVPLIFGVGFYCVKSESADMRILAICAAVVGLLCVLGAPDPGWFNPTWYGMPLGGGVTDPDKLSLIMRSIALLLVAGCGGAFWYLGVFLEERARVGAESHLVGVTLENEQRRKALRESYGTDIADHNDGFLDES